MLAPADAPTQHKNPSACGGVRCGTGAPPAASRSGHKVDEHRADELAAAPGAVAVAAP